MIRSHLTGWLLGLVLLAAPTGATEPAVVLFFGDSLTAGYGVAKENGFPARVQVLADSSGCALRVVNAGLAGETTAAGLRRVDWILQKPVDVFVLELGGNDGLRGVPLAETERNLRGIIDRVRAKSPQAQLVLVGVRLPPNLGAEYTEGFAAIFPRLANARHAVLIPDLLQGVAGDRSLMRADGIHPNVAGHRLVAQTVWRQLEPLLCAAPADSAGAAQDFEGRNTGHAAAAEEPDENGQ